MDIYRKMTVWELLSFLKSRVKENVDQINHNISELRQFRKEFSQHPEIQVEINKSNRKISDLTDENNRLLGMFNELLKFHNSHFKELYSKETNNEVEVFNLTEDEIAEFIEDTLSGDMPINENHPLLLNDNTIESLLERLLEKEMYEECAAIQHIRENRHQ